MDLKLKALLLSVRALLVVLIHGITLLIDVIGRYAFDESRQPLSELSRTVNNEVATLLPL